ncbi:unnamed protein product [Rotaria magnacalcarata]|uniref:Uncharacterized protein n=2 Tax=Rotaria magnacalcarata TaxID=392030 RepID=A0A816XRD1_9BILA|nr:unnamed protein product [Rotaria magnacalcarata]CAF4195941.1 unnamed protein product [Rotaria magnacalcarata]
MNDLIDNDERSMTYSTIDQAIQAVLKTGPKAFLYKYDMASAFKLLPIRPSIVPFYGCHWSDQVYFFVRLSLGGRSSPRIFVCLSQALEWILLNKYHVQYCQHRLDSFLTVDCSEQESLRTMAIIISLEYLGIILDTDVFETRIPVDKINRMCNLIRQLSRKKRCTRRELLQLIGHFNFATRIIIPADSYGYGGIFGSKWFSGIWDDDFIGLALHKRNSTLLELMPIVISAVLWGANWSRRRIIFYCDNQVLVYILNKRRSADSIIMMFIRRLALLSFKYNFHLMALPIAGTTNDIADAISRQQWARFHHLSHWADTFPCQIPNPAELIYPIFL